MSHIVRSGHLVRTPELQHDESGAYVLARVLVTDRVRQAGGAYDDGSTVSYDVRIEGPEALELIRTAERSGNLRVLFSGRYRVTEHREQGEIVVRHNVLADEVGVSLRNQSVKVDSLGNLA